MKSETVDRLEQFDRLLPDVYAEMRRIASSQMSRERGDHTLQTTALVHEAYLRLSAQQSINWDDEKDVLEASVVMMRRILVDYARAKNSRKRRASGNRVPLDDVPIPTDPSEDLISLDIALNELKQLDSRQADIVELRYFGGLTLQEVAEHCDISLATTKREWAMAKAWLYRRVHVKA